MTSISNISKELTSIQLNLNKNLPDRPITWLEQG